MKWILAFTILMAMFVAMFSLTPRAAAGEKKSAMSIKVGVYDSRLVAFAYARSDKFMARIKEMRGQLEAAKASGDQETVSRLEAEGPALQDQLHKQVFGNAPIPEIMARIEGRLRAIAKEAGVDMIVCTWDVAYLGDGVEFIDVSVPMMKLFDPTEETLAAVQEIRNTPPVPAEELGAHDH